MFLPEIYESEVASPSKSTSSYSSTMPAYNLHEHKGRGQYGMLSISSIDKSAGVRSSSPGRRRNASSSPRVGKSDSPRKETGKNSRGWFHGGRKNAKTSQKDGFSDSVIEGVVQGNNMIRSSPMLHVRSAMRSGENDQFGRPQADPDELSDEEERMQLSYDAPVDVTRGELSQRNSLVCAGREYVTTFSLSYACTLAPACYLLIPLPPSLLPPSLPPFSCYRADPTHSTT